MPHGPAPLRLEFPGATYHVTARGDRREDIFVDDADRASPLNVLALGLQRFDAVALAYCLMGNHYHFVPQTRQSEPVAPDAPREWRLHAALQPAARQGGAPVPGSLQGHPGRHRRLPAHAVPLRGTEPGARRVGRKPAGLGVVELPRACGRGAVARLAGHAWPARATAGPRWLYSGRIRPGGPALRCAAGQRSRTAAVARGAAAADLPGRRRLCPEHAGAGPGRRRRRLREVPRSQRRPPSSDARRGWQ
ncbi:MAG: hypothetical protein MZW92_72955 [Comamonadaceae bacterium]|nr:hypothetical protein [Comamonadaceae bacterium]